MPSLKQYRVRIASVKSTQKITSAMKMVAAAKLRRAQEKAEAARPYAERMSRMLGSLAGSLVGGAGAPILLSGTGRQQVHLVVVATSDRGLCGAFNSSIVRGARQHIRQLLNEGKQVKIFCVGRKGRDQLRRDFAKLIVETMEDVGRRSLSFADAQRITDRILAMFQAGEFDVCSLFYARFKSAISQIVTRQQLIPFAVDEGKAGAGGPAITAGGAIYEYEPDEEQILTELLPRNLSVQVFRALLENSASEQGSRMTAMDNATRNAGDMIKRLTLSYNRQRQASITKELIEIISGAEAV
jgi:F-type H+-transporting ATPase subunit gamma